MDEVYNVVVWFNNGESRTFGAIKTYLDADGIALKCPEGGVVSISTDNVAIVYDPTREWSGYWDA